MDINIVVVLFFVLMLIAIFVIASVVIRTASFYQSEILKKTREPQKDEPNKSEH